MSTMTSELPLSELVSRAHNEGRVPYRQMEKRAKIAGHTISHSQLQAYATGNVRKAPTNEQLRAIAAAIDVGFETVRLASFQQYFQYRPHLIDAQPATRTAAAIPRDLSPKEDEELARVVRAYVAGLRSGTDS